MKEIFAERLVNEMWHQKITQAELSRRSTISKAVISHYMHGRQVPNSASILAIADVLNVSVDYLLGRTERKNLMR